MFTKMLSYAFISAVLVGTIFAVELTTAALGDPPDNEVQTEAGCEDICLTPGCVHAASAVLKNMDPNTDPCDDFYKFACGGYIESTRIPDDKNSVTYQNVLDDKIEEQLRTTMEGKSEPNEGKASRLVKNLYKSCMNMTAIEAERSNFVSRILDTSGGWPVIHGDRWNSTSFNWTSSIYSLHSYNFTVNFFIDISIAVDPNNSSKPIIVVDQPTLGLSREYLLKGLENYDVWAYYKKMVNMAVSLGAEVDRADIELTQSLLFEIKIATISLSNEKRHSATESYHSMSLTELTTNYPSVPWRDYFSEVLSPAISLQEIEILNVKVSSYISDFEKLMASTPKRVQANYLMWRTAEDMKNPIRSVERMFSEHIEKSLYGEIQRRSTEPSLPRWKECMAMVSAGLSINLGAMYVRKYFNENTRKKVAEIAMDIKNQYYKILQRVEWMDEKTQQRVLRTATNVSWHIGYPDKLLDDKSLDEFYDLELSEGSYFNNIMNLTLFYTKNSNSKMNELTDWSDWKYYGTAATAEAGYLGITNAIMLYAGVLQGAFFSNDRPRYMNYGAIGFVIGHELTHAFDNEGRQFDADDNMTYWWTPFAKEKYHERVQCIIDQYGNYTVEEVELNLNGIRTQGENIADNGGAKIAYLAYNNWVKRNAPEKKLPGLPYTPNQMFRISTANSWCSKLRPEEMKFLIATDVRVLEKFRILGALSNMPEFSKDFNCPIGSKMNPKKKCSVW